MAEAGVFRTTRRASDSLDAIEQELLSLLAAHDYEAFMGLAVRSKKNIVVSGATGSGKTTFTKALIREIPREDQQVARPVRAQDFGGLADRASWLQQRGPP
jgi:type IV secretion system protein VirB11